MGEEEGRRGDRRLAPGLALGVLAVSSGSVFVRLAQAEAVPTLSIAAWRLVFACAILLPIAMAARAREIASVTGREALLLAASGLFLGLHFATWIASLGYTTVASSVVLVSTGPLFVGLGSWLFLGERPSLRLALGLGTALVGAALIGWGDFGGGRNALLGDLLALAGGAMVAGFFMVGRRLRERTSLLAYIAPVYGVAMLTLLAIAGVAGSPMGGFSAAGYGWMLCLGLIPQLIGHSSLNWALRRLSATYVSIVTLAEPVGACALAYLFLREAPGWAPLVGGPIILTGIWVASRK